MAALTYQRAVPWEMGQDLETWAYNQAMTHLPGFTPQGWGPRTWTFQKGVRVGLGGPSSNPVLPIGLLFLLIKSRDQVCVTLYEFAGQEAIAFRAGSEATVKLPRQASIDHIVYAHSPRFLLFPRASRGGELGYFRLPRAAPRSRSATAGVMPRPPG